MQVELQLTVTLNTASLSCMDCLDLLAGVGEGDRGGEFLMEVESKKGTDRRLCYR